MGAILSRSGMTVWICTFPIRPEKKISSMTSLWRDRRGERRSSSFENRFSSWDRKNSISTLVLVLKSGIIYSRSLPDRIRIQLWIWSRVRIPPLRMNRIRRFHLEYLFTPYPPDITAIKSTSSSSIWVFLLSTCFFNVAHFNADPDAESAESGSEIPFWCQSTCGSFHKCYTVPYMLKNQIFFTFSNNVALPVFNVFLSHQCQKCHNFQKYCLPTLSFAWNLYRSGFAGLGKMMRIQPDPAPLPDPQHCS